MRDIKTLLANRRLCDYEDPYGEFELELETLKDEIERLQKLCDKKDLELIDCNFGLLQMDLEDSKKEVQALQKQLQEKDEIICDLQKQLQKQTQKKRVGRPSKYEEYYTLIHELYKKYKRVTMVANELSKMGIEISLRQVNNIVHMKLGNNCK